jgi:hypothetical protein
MVVGGPDAGDGMVSITSTGATTTDQGDSGSSRLKLALVAIAVLIAAVIAGGES